MADLIPGESPVAGAFTAAARKSVLEKFKWKKLAVQALQEHHGTLKLSKLQKQLRVAANLNDDLLVAHANAAIESRLKGSSQFVFTGKTITLAASADK